MKEPLLPSPAAGEGYPRRLITIQRYRRSFLATLLIITFLILAWMPWSEDSDDYLEKPVPSGQDDAPRLINLETHIMSKCPDAQDCLRDLVLPAMEKVADKVNFTMSYIGTPTRDDDGVACKHGPSECLGNILELCAASLYPSPMTYLGFTMCLTNHYQDIPDRNLVEDCALEHGIDFARLNVCVSSDDGYGVSLLRDSVERSADAGVKISCTDRLDENVRCVRDGGAWKDCEGGSKVQDLVRDVEKMYEDKQPTK